MAFSNPNVTAYIDGSEQRTEEIKFKADTLQNITMKLPAVWYFITWIPVKQAKVVLR